MTRALRGLLAVTAREVAERWALLGLAAVLAVVPLVAPRLGLGDRPLLAVFLWVVVVLAAAVVTGSSVIARDLAEGRLGFFLARPMPWWSIGGGKLLAAAILTFTAGLVVILPRLPGDDVQVPAASWYGVILAPTLLVMIGAAHAVAVGYRSRSPWFALDLGLAAVAAGVMASTWRTGPWGTALADYRVVSAALWLAAVAFVSAAAVGFARGGTDIRRVHGALSTTFWSLTIPALAAYAAWGAWVPRVAPGDIERVRLAWPSPSRPWVTVLGEPRWPRPQLAMATLLVDLEGGRFLRLGAFPSVRGPVFSGDGTRAVWIAHERAGPRLRTADLRAPRPDVVDHPLLLPANPILGLALSADGRALAVVQWEHVSLLPVGAAQPLATAQVLPGTVRQAVFTSNGRVRALRRTPAAGAVRGLDVVAIDPAMPRMAVVGEIATRGNPTEVWSRGGERVAVLHRPDFRPSLTLHDGRDGRLLAAPVAEGAAGRVSVAFLEDGRLAVVTATRATELHLFDREGTHTVTVPIASSFAHTRMSAVADDLVAVELLFQGGDERSDTVVVEASTGRILRREPGLRPASTARAWLGSPTPPTGDLFIDDGGSLVRLDFSTGQRRVVLPGGGER